MEVNNGGANEAQEPLENLGEEGPFYMESQIWPLGSFSTFSG
jgi:hypothetical protein